MVNNINETLGVMKELLDAIADYSELKSCTDSNQRVQHYVQH